MAVNHIDLRTKTREGWFEKAQPKSAKPNYSKECEASGNGCYHGPRWEAHHILPQTAIQDSIKEFIDSKPGAKKKADVKRYISEVQWITKWNINSPEQMIGLPTFHSYAQFYAGDDPNFPARIEPTGTKGRERGLVKWFNSFKLKTRKKWANEFLDPANQPKNRPIHNPVCWGHTDYNMEVKSQLIVRVWDRLSIKQDDGDHDVDAAAVESALNALRGDMCTLLKGRGSTSKDAWVKRDPDWWDPFCMISGIPDPIS